MMAPQFKVRFAVPAEVVVYVEGKTEDEAADMAHDMAQRRLSEVAVYSNGVAVFADLDGIAEDEIEEAHDGN